MMAIKLFIGIFFGFLIFTTNIAHGTRLAGKEKLPLRYRVGTSNIGCSTGDMTCRGGHEYYRKKSLKENIGGMLKGGIGISHADDNKESIKNIQGEGCVNNDLSCNDVNGPNINNKNKRYAVNKNGYPNIENNDVVTNNRNNLNNNGSQNNIGNKSGSNNGAISRKNNSVIRGNVSQNGNETVNGSGSVNNNSVGIGDESGKGNNVFHYNEGSPATPDSA
ncbi:unnamed protein product [Lactuca virosa]|uniref:Uncharacterized protein n=1 Tax=Lactuca virosa TaxID=75947 RepID=A0AAU9N650_9ASTR|nr:unnamed protein product [Lactuca virosa]